MVRGGACRKSISVTWFRRSSYCTSVLAWFYICGTALPVDGSADNDFSAKGLRTEELRLDLTMKNFKKIQMGKLVMRMWGRVLYSTWRRNPASWAYAEAKGSTESGGSNCKMGLLPLV